MTATPLPIRATLSPETLDERAADRAAWRRALVALRSAGRAAGFRVEARQARSGPASWDLVTVLFTGSGTAVSIFDVSGADCPAVVRQFEPQTIHTGPNHNAPATVEGVVALASALAALPFERDACAHCGRDESRRTDQARGA